MKKLAVLERPTYQPAYRIQEVADRACVRSPYAARFGLLRDAPEASESSWESFDESSLLTYFARGMNLLHKNIAQLQDFMQSYSAQDEKNLLFMTESLLQARRLIEATQFPASQEKI